jgi:two-component system, LytTR family, response regulator
MSIRCAIVDDEPLARARIARLLLREPGFQVAGEHGDARAALASLAADPPDLLFLDVHMPELDGFELLAALPTGALPPTIFVTAHDTYAVRAFEHHALDYLKKPVTAARFHAALTHARRRLSSGGEAADLHRLLAYVDSSRPNRIAVKSATATRLLRTDEIDWIESADNYALIHSGAHTHLVRESMQALEERLAAARFARIHRGTIVNLDRIRELQPIFAGDWLVVLESGTRLRLSRTFRQRLLDRLGLGHDGNDRE